MQRATFSGFVVARSGLTASMKALNVTGQNITNVNTEGYTRQRLDQVSLSQGYGNFSSSSYVTQIGDGVLVTGVSQVRDKYLDIQYRNQMANVGAADAKDSILDQVADVFDETMTSGIKDAFTDLESQLLELANSTGEISDSIVRASMQSLVNLFHSCSKLLADKREQITDDFNNNSVRQVNELLENIAELNKTIKSSQVLGYPALELQDQRNQLLDELSSYIPIEVVYQDEQISTDEKVDNVVVNILLTEDNGTITRNCIIDNEKYGKFESETDDKFTAVTLNYLDENRTEQTIEITDNRNGKITNLINGGTFKGTLDMLNSSGIFDGDATAEKGLGYYEQAFDLLVDTFAQKMNELNAEVTDQNGNTYGGALFVNSSNSNSFTASDIMINEEWIKGNVSLRTKIDPDDGSTQNDNINKFIEALDDDSTEFKLADGTTLFYTGDFYDYYVDQIESILGIDQQSTQNLLDNHITVMNTIIQSREEVSGVSLDEEAVNLMQYQQSYTAAARLMTALDEVLNVLINNTGVCGR